MITISSVEDGLWSSINCILPQLKEEKMKKIKITLMFGSICLLFASCKRISPEIDVNGYEYLSFESTYGYKLSPSVNPKDILKKVHQSERIKGPMKGAAVNEFTFVNSNISDTLRVCIYRDGNKSTHFSINEDWCRKNIENYPKDNNFPNAFFESKEPLLP